MSKKISMKSGGFTLIEVLVVIVISSLLLGMVVAGQREFSRKKVIENVAVTVLSDLRQAQSQSTAGVKPDDARCRDPYRLEGYSVTFDNAGYAISAVCKTDSGTTVQLPANSYIYPSGVTVSSRPSVPILFKSIGEGTDLTSAQRLAICAFSRGQEIVISQTGDISQGDYDCTAVVPTTAPSGTPVSASGDGLYGQYFENNDLTNLSGGFVRVDRQVNFNWGSGGPTSGGAGVGTEGFSIRWAGRVLAPVTGTYTFTTASDDGVRLYVNGVQIINNWTRHALTNNSGTINLTAGQYYSIRLEYYEDGGSAQIVLRWRRPGASTEEVIPQGYLFSS